MDPLECSRSPVQPRVTYTTHCSPSVSSSVSRKSSFCQITNIRHFWKSLTSFLRLVQSLSPTLAIDREADIPVWAVREKHLERDHSYLDSSTCFLFAVCPTFHLVRRSRTQCGKIHLVTMRMQATGWRGSCRKVIILASPVASSSTLAMDLLFPDFLLQEKKIKYHRCKQLWIFHCLSV